MIKILHNGISRLELTILHDALRTTHADLINRYCKPTTICMECPVKYLCRDLENVVSHLQRLIDKTT